MFTKNSLVSNLGSFCLGTVFIGVVAIIHNQQTKKLTTEKNKHISSLNRKIGYGQCKIDELKDQKKKLNGKKIFRNSVLKTQLQEIDTKIKKQEVAIKECEKKIEQILSCKNSVMLREMMNVSLHEKQIDLH